MRSSRRAIAPYIYKHGGLKAAWTHQSNWAVGRVCGWPAGNEPPAAGSGIAAGSGEEAGHRIASTTCTHDVHTWKLLTIRAVLSSRPATITCRTRAPMSPPNPRDFQRPVHDFAGNDAPRLMVNSMHDVMLSIHAWHCAVRHQRMHADYMIRPPPNKFVLLSRNSCPLR